MRGLRHLRLDRHSRSGQRAQCSVCAELARRHAEAFAELLAEVVLRVEAAAARDLRHAHIAVLEQAGCFFEALLLEEVAEEASGEPVEAARDILARVAELFRHGFDGQLFVGTHAAAHRLDQSAQEAIHSRSSSNAGALLYTSVQRAGRRLFDLSVATS